MDGTMRAARIHRVGERVRVEAVPIPDIGPGEVLIRVLRAGLNRGDVHMRDGDFDRYESHGLTLIKTPSVFIRLDSYNSWHFLDD